MAALHPEGRSFQLGEDEARLLKLKGAAEAQREGRCAPKGFSGPKLTLVLRGVSKPSTAAPSRENGADLLTRYRDLLKYLPVYCSTRVQLYGTSTAAVPQSPACEARAGDPENYQRFGEFINRDPDAVLADLNSIMSFTREEVRIFQTYHAVLGMSSGSEMFSYLETQKNTLTKDEKLKLVLMFGERFGRDYDDRRLSGAASRGVVSADAILKAAVSQQYEDFLVDMDLQSGIGRRAKAYTAGVCRDIAPVQALMLKALGFKHSYVISYKTVADRHSAVLVQDSDNPSVIHNIDYGQGLTRQGQTGVKTILRNSDLSMQYEISEPDGKSLKTIPSEMGKFLAEAAGFDTHQLDPMAQVSSNLVGANLAFNEKWQSRVFWGEDANQVRYLGAAGNFSYGQGGYVPGKIGAAFTHQMRHDSLTPYGIGNSQTEMIYLQVEQKLKSPDAKLPADVQARLEATATAIASYYWYRDEKQKATGLQGDGRLELGVSVDQGKSASGRFSSRYFAGAELVKGWKDVRSLDSSNFRVQLNRALLTADGRAELGKTPLGRAYLIAGAKVLGDAFGIRQRVEAGAATERLALTGAFESRAKGDFLPFIEGSEKKASGHATVQPWRAVRLDVEAYRSMESDPLLRDRTGMFATLLFSH